MRQLKRFTIVNAIASLLLLVAFALLSYDRFHAEEIRENSEHMEHCIGTFRELLKNKGESFSAVDDKLLAGNYVINGNFEVPDKVQEIFGGTATVFMGDKRVSTNVLLENGRRAVGTKLEGAAYDAIFKQGKSFRGETYILGVPYLTAYDPIRDSTGKIIGALYVGLEKSAFLAQFTAIKIEIALILLGLMTAFTTFMILFNRMVKKAESTIEADHKFLQTIIDAIPTPVFYKDVHGKYLGGNKAFEEYNGLPTAQLIGKTAFDLLPSHLADHVYECEQELLQKLGLLVEEIAMPHTDGTLREVIYLKTTFLATDGSTGGLIGTMLDITDRKLAEEKLRESERSLTDIIQFYPDATLVIDCKGKVIAWNHAMEELSGVKAEEMLGKENYEYALPFYGERRPLLIDLTLQPAEEIEKKYTKIEHRSNTLIAEGFLHNDRGEKFYFQGTAASLHNSAGEIIGAIESIRDITGRKRMEEELKFRNTILSTQQECSIDGILVVDECAAIISYNRKFVEIWGIPPELVEAGDDAPVLQFVTSLLDDPEGFLARIKHLYEQRDEKSREEIVLKDGRVIDRYSAPMTGADRQYYGRIWYFRDITRRKRTEEEVLVLNKELGQKVEEKTRELLDAQEELVRKEKLAILGQLSGSVGHELRNPLGVMSNAVYFLKMVHAGSDETTREYLDMITHEIDNSQRIISDLLDFARTKAPQTKMVTARQLIDESLGKCVVPDNVDLQTDLPDTLPLLNIDSLQMEQVLQNLITNAIQAMPGGGALSIAARLAGAGLVPAPDQEGQPRELPLPDLIEISVADTGEGIAPENMKKLFQPLFTTKAKGIGLGLVVCRNLVEANGGKIEVESEAERGTIFRVILPA